MVVHTNSPRVKHSRKLVLEMLASSVDLSTTPQVAEWIAEYDAKPERFGPAAPPAPAGTRDASIPGHHAPPDPAYAATVAEPTKIDNDLYVRDYAKCILCYKCVEACGPDHQNTFAIAVAGRGFDAHISTEFAVPLPESACVYCGNCIAVCPTGALMAKTEFDKRAAGTWDESRMTHDGHDLSVLRRGLHAAAARRRRRDRQSDVAAREFDHAGQSLHQGPLRVALRAESRRRANPPSNGRPDRLLDRAWDTPSRRRSARMWRLAEGEGDMGLADGGRRGADRARLQRPAVRRRDGNAGRSRGPRRRLQLTEGVVASEGGIERVDVVQREPRHRAPDRDCVRRRRRGSSERARGIVSRTGCGLCGIETINDALRLPQTVVDFTLDLSRDALWRASAELSQQQTLNNETNTVHAAAWANTDGELQRRARGRRPAQRARQGARRARAGASVGDRRIRRS